jgi:hypothetical protein
MQRIHFSLENKYFSKEDARNKFYFFNNQSGIPLDLK